MGWGWVVACGLGIGLLGSLYFGEVWADPGGRVLYSQSYWLGIGARALGFGCF